jgi:signal transduction histidine kinase/HAMP domain-containing protein
MTASQEKTVAGVALRAQSLDRARQAARGVDDRLASVELLLDSAISQARRSRNGSLQGILADSSELSRALTIAVIDTSGSRKALFLGDGRRIDGIPMARRSSLATMAIANARLAATDDVESFVDEGRGRSADDSIAMIIVRPLARAASGCDCLAAEPGAIVATLSDRAIQLLLASDSTTEGAVIALTGSSGWQLGRLATPERWTDRDVRDSNTFGGMLEKEGTLDMLGPDNVQRGVGFAVLKRMPWRVYVGTPMSTPAAAKRLRDSVALALLSLLIAGIGATLAARRITVPLQTLAADAKRIAAGASSHRTATAKEPGDIGDLGGAINSLALEFETKRKVMQEELRLSSQVFDESPIAMWVSDASTVGTGSGRIQQANAATGRLLDVAAPSLIGQRDTELFLTASAEAIAPQHATRAERVRIRTATATLRTRTGSRECALWVVEVLHALRPVRVVCAMPADAMSSAAPMAQIPEVARVIAPADDDAIVTFAARVSDEVGEVLNGIAGFAQLAMESDDDADMRRIALERIADLSHRGDALMRQVRAVGQHETLNLSQLDANETMSAAAEALSDVLGSDVVLERRFNATPATVQADPVLLQSVVSALIENAHDAMPESGTLTLATTLVEVAAGAPQSYAVGAGHYVVLTVADTGVGMSESDQSKMFEPYYSTKQRAGAGLSLAAVSGIAKQHGWAMTVDSVEGSGTAISLYLPLVTYSATMLLDSDDEDYADLETLPARSA